MQLCKILTLIASILLLTACGATENKKEESNSSSGNLEVTLNSNIKGRTLSPIKGRTLSPDLDTNITTFSISVSGPNDQSLNLSTAEDTVNIKDLSFGQWHISVSGFNTEDQLIVSASTDFEIHSNETTSVSLELLPLSGEGQLNLSLSWPENTLENPTIESTLKGSNGDVLSAEFTQSSEVNYATFSGSYPAGYYTAIIKLLDNDALSFGHVEVIRIMDNQTTDGNIVFEKINEVSGQIDLNIATNVQLPIDVSIVNAPSELTIDTTANISVAVDDSVLSFVYAWYINGELIDTTNAKTFDFSPTETGNYNIGVTVFTVDGDQAGSSNHVISVIEAQQDPVSFTYYEVSDLRYKTTDIDIVDVNGDEVLDVIEANYFNVDTQINMGTSSTTFETSSLGGADLYTRSMQTGDIDNDLDIDIVLISSDESDSTQLVRTYINDGSGNFTEASQPIGLSSEGDNLVAYAYDASLADFDGDDDLDLYIARDHGSDVLYLNDGSGNYTLSEQSFVYHRSTNSAIADMNGDGKTDIVVATMDKGIIINFGNNDGTFTELEAYPYARIGLSIGDLNGDGFPDVATTTATNSEAQLILLNDGTGKLTETDQLFGEGLSWRNKLGDVDNDGDLDLILVHLELVYSTQLFLNDGTGNFTDSGIEFGNSPTSSYRFYNWDAEMADMDNDGYLDILISGEGYTQLYINNL